MRGRVPAQDGRQQASSRERPSRAQAQAEKLLGQQGRRLQRPVHVGGKTAGLTGDAALVTFSLAYLRATPPAARRGLAVLVIPGGPGLASALPYRGLRARAAGLGLDVVMVEHRGVGLSRGSYGGPDAPVAGGLADGPRSTALPRKSSRELAGDLPREAVTVEAVVDDLAAVLDDAGLGAVVVYGSSYGTYLAQAFAAVHPHRVAALVLDSPMLNVLADRAMSGAHRRRLLWDGKAGQGSHDTEDSEGTASGERAAVAAAIRELAARGEPAAALSTVVQVVYELTGLQVLHRLVAARSRGRLGRTWSALAGLGSRELSQAGQPFVAEPDLVAQIAYGQLGYGLPVDGGPLDPQATLAAGAQGQQAFRGEPFDLAAALAGASWPVVVMSGDRDLRTPRPVAQRIVETAPRGVLVELRKCGHSALDTHQEAALQVMQAVVGADGQVGALPTADQLAMLPRRGASRWAGAAVSAVVKVVTRRPRVA